MKSFRLFCEDIIIVFIMQGTALKQSFVLKLKEKEEKEKRGSEKKSLLKAVIQNVFTLKWEKIVKLNLQQEKKESCEMCSDTYVVEAEMKCVSSHVSWSVGSV